ncbi:hypothetical protein OG609_21935 [Streptomyces sp. NBC_01224]|uniref:hypothetical protein n=1 Tax=unclassified Streptomyces TaxID=2593676 RepID=UPI002E0FC0F8|nr:hypothetical protein OG609_21935 [Streptomyces sp. NBC_01224]
MPSKSSAASGTTLASPVASGSWVCGSHLAHSQSSPPVTMAMPTSSGACRTAGWHRRALTTPRAASDDPSTLTTPARPGSTTAGWLLTVDIDSISRSAAALARVSYSTVGSFRVAGRMGVDSGAVPTPTHIRRKSGSVARRSHTRRRAAAIAHSR